MALLALINDMALGQGVLSCTVKATWAVLTDNPADGTLVKDVSWCALYRWRSKHPDLGVTLTTHSLLSHKAHTQNTHRDRTSLSTVASVTRPGFLVPALL